MKAKFTELIVDAKQKKTEIILFFQTLFFLMILTIVGRISITPVYLIKSLLGMWFCWIHIKNIALLRKIKVLNTAIIDDLKNEREDVHRDFKIWEPYLKQAIRFSVYTFLLTIVIVKLLPISLPMDSFLLFISINLLVYFISRFVAIKRFIAEVVNIYAVNLKLKTNWLKEQPQLVNLFLQGFAAGSLYLIVIYTAFEMSFLHYFLHYLAFSSLAAFSISLMAIYRYFNSAVKCIDAIRLEQ